jgi:hypothetical protein
MAYYVYHSSAHERAQIHYADCICCNHGFGQPEVSGLVDGKWLGPFDSYKHAEVAARETEACMDDCEFCGL